MRHIGHPSNALHSSLPSRFRVAHTKGRRIRPYLPLPRKIYQKRIVSKIRYRSSYQFPPIRKYLLLPFFFFSSVNQSRRNVSRRTNDRVATPCNPRVQKFRNDRNERYILHSRMISRLKAHQRGRKINECNCRFFSLFLFLSFSIKYEGRKGKWRNDEEEILKFRHDRNERYILHSRMISSKGKRNKRTSVIVESFSPFRKSTREEKEGGEMTRKKF